MPLEGSPPLDTPLAGSKSENSGTPAAPGYDGQEPGGAAAGGAKPGEATAGEATPGWGGGALGVTAVEARPTIGVASGDVGLLTAP